MILDEFWEELETDSLAYAFGRLFYLRCSLRDNIDKIEEFYKINTQCLAVRQQLIFLGAYDFYELSNRSLPIDLKYEYFMPFDDGFEHERLNNDPSIKGVQNNSKSYKRQSLPSWKKNRVYRRDNYTCQECGFYEKHKKKLEIDHIIPLSRGGTDGIGNLQVLCQTCNRIKSNQIQ